MSAAQLYQQLGLDIHVPIPPPHPPRKRKKTKPSKAAKKPLSGENSDPNVKCQESTTVVTSLQSVHALCEEGSRDAHVTPAVTNGSSECASRDLEFESRDAAASFESNCNDGNCIAANKQEAEANRRSLASSIVAESLDSSYSCSVSHNTESSGNSIKRKRTNTAHKPAKKKRKSVVNGDAITADKTETSTSDIRNSEHTPTSVKRKEKKSGEVRIVDRTVDMFGSKKKKQGIDGREEGKRMFEWLLHPVNSDQFFRDLWESKPLLIKRHNPRYNEGWFSSEDFSRILRDNPIQFGTHLDLTSYRDGARATHNQPGRAFPHLVWKHYKAGGSIRMLNPQTYSEKVWLLLNTLGDFFRSTMGANVYLTAPGTQGFAPHWDDIEAFLIQLEGKKHWRLYAPRHCDLTLPRHSSPNISQTELGKPILDTILEAGDMLYFPRGTIHQGDCLPDTHSLHLTISTYQLNTWGDLLEDLLPKALSLAREEDRDYRAGLPRDYLDYAGLSKSDVDSPSRSSFLSKVEELMGRLVKYAPVDGAVDSLGAKFLHESLPPHPLRGSVAEYATHSQCTRGALTASSPSVSANSRVRLTTPYCARVVARQDCVCLQHSASNTRLIHEIEQQEIDYHSDYGPALETLTNSYPRWVQVSALPELHQSAATQLVQELVDMSILQVYRKPAHNTSVTTFRSKGRKSSPDKIRSKRRSSTEDDIPVKLGTSDRATLPKPPGKGHGSYPANRKNKSLEPRSTGKSSTLEKMFNYRRCSDL